MTQDREITGKDGAPMVLIPVGEFWMGSPDDEGDKDEHHVIGSIWTRTTWIDLK